MVGARSAGADTANGVPSFSTGLLDGIRLDSAYPALHARDIA